MTQSWFTPIAVLLGLFDLVAAVAVATEPDGKMPGQAIGPVFLVGFGISMFVGLWLRWRAQFDRATVNERARRPRPVSATSMLIGLAFLGVVFTALGMMTTPLATVVGVSCLIVAVGIAAGALRRRNRPVDDAPRPERAAKRSPWLADGLIVAGTLPAIGLWWMVIPPILALIVIGGVIGTQPGTRSHATA